MPELPEVEQVKKTLAPHIVGRRIEKTEIYLPRMLKYPSVEAFTDGTEGRLFINITRRGKYLQLHLDNEAYLLTHLRMTGALLALPKSASTPDFARFRFALSGNEDLWFTDIRTFGVVALITPGCAYVDRGFCTLGPEPLSAEFTDDYLYEKSRGRKRRLKEFILDQSVIAGLGNIYADESLALSRLHPLRAASSLTRGECAHLCRAINRVIAQGIANHGTTFRNYRDGNGESGENQNHLLVYGRKGQACSFCGTTLEQIKVGGRGSVYCPHCQKL